MYRQHSLSKKAKTPMQCAHFGKLLLLLGANHVQIGHDFQPGYGRSTKDWWSDRDSEMTDKDLERRKTRHATLSPYANIASSVNLKSGAFTYHPPYPLRRRRHE